MDEVPVRYQNSHLIDENCNLHHGDFLLHKEVSKSKKDVIISTGMSTFSEIEKVLKLYKNKFIP